MFIYNLYLYPAKLDLTNDYHIQLHITVNEDMMIKLPSLIGGEFLLLNVIIVHFLLILIYALYNIYGTYEYLFDGNKISPPHGGDILI